MFGSNAKGMHVYLVLILMISVSQGRFTPLSYIITSESENINSTTPENVSILENTTLKFPEELNPTDKFKHEGLVLAYLLDISTEETPNSRDVTTESSKSDDDFFDQTAAIVSGTVGAVAMLLIMIALIFWYYRKKEKAKLCFETEEIPEAEPEEPEVVVVVEEPVLDPESNKKPEDEESKQETESQVYYKKMSKQFLNGDLSLRKASTIYSGIYINRFPRYHTLTGFIESINVKENRINVNGIAAYVVPSITEGEDYLITKVNHHNNPEEFWSFACKQKVTSITLLSNTTNAFLSTIESFKKCRTISITANEVKRNSDHDKCVLKLQQNGSSQNIHLEHFTFCPNEHDDIVRDFSKFVKSPKDRSKMLIVSEELSKAAIYVAFDGFWQNINMRNDIDFLKSLVELYKVFPDISHSVEDYEFLNKCVNLEMDVVQRMDIPIPILQRQSAYKNGLNFILNDS